MEEMVLPRALTESQTSIPSRKIFVGEESSTLRMIVVVVGYGFLMLPLAY